MTSRPFLYPSFFIIGGFTAVIGLLIDPITALVFFIAILSLFALPILITIPNKTLLPFCILLIPFSVRLPLEVLPFGLASLLLFLIAAKTILGRLQLRIIPNSLNLFVFGFLTWLILTSLLGIDPVNSLRRSYNIFVFVLFFFVIIDFATNLHSLKRLYKAMLASAILLAIMGLVQFSVGVINPAIVLATNVKMVPLFSGLRVAERLSFWVQGYPSNWYAPAFGLVRATGTTFTPMAFAQILLLSFFPALAILITREPIVSRGYWFTIVLLIGLAIFTTLSRGSWLALLVGIVIVGWHYGIRPRQLAQKTVVRLLSFFFVALLGLFLILPNSFKMVMLDAVTSIFNPEQTQQRQFRLSNESRFYTYELGLNVITQSPIIGIGAGNFAEAVGGVDGLSSHNVYLNVTAEMGLIGGLLYLGILLLACRNFIRIKHYSTQPRIRALAVGWLASLASLMIYWLFTAYIYEPMLGMTLWLVLGLSVAMTRPEFA